MSLNESKAGLEVDALESLLELAVKLKKSGILELLDKLLDETEKLKERIDLDLAAQRFYVLLESLLTVIQKIDESKLNTFREQVEEEAGCLVVSLSRTDPDKIKRVGFTGLLGALRDPDVQRAVGFLVAFLKNFGRCIGEQKP